MREDLMQMVDEFVQQNDESQQIYSVQCWGDSENEDGDNNHKTGKDQSKDASKDCAGAFTTDVIDNSVYL